MKYSKKKHALGVTAILLLCLLIVGVLYEKDTTIVGAATNLNLENLPDGRDALKDISEIGAWTATNAFVTSYGTKKDTDIPIRNGSTGRISGKVLKERSLSDLYCAFPYTPYLPKNLKKLDYTSTIYGTPLINYYLEPKRQFFGRQSGGEVVRHAPLWFMKITRVNPVKNDSNHDYGNQPPVTDSLLVEIDDRGPLQAGTEGSSYDNNLRIKGIPGTLDCSPAVLRSLGLRTTFLDKRSDKVENGDVVNAELVPIDSFLDQVLFANQFLPISQGGVVIAAPDNDVQE